MCILCGFDILFHFLWNFLLSLSVFYAFSALEFTLIMNLVSLLADGIVTIFLPVVSSYKELFIVATGYDDAIEKSIIFSDVSREGACDNIAANVAHAMSKTEWASADNSIRLNEKLNSSLE